eukprot:4316852-Amphidinium_carterae.1
MEHNMVQASQSEAPSPSKAQQRAWAQSLDSKATRSLCQSNVESIHQKSKWQLHGGPFVFFTSITHTETSPGELASKPFS